MIILIIVSILITKFVHSNARLMTGTAHAAWRKRDCERVIKQVTYNEQ